MLASPGGACGAVMAIGDVQRADICKGTRDRIRSGACKSPKCVPHPVNGREVEQRLLLRFALDDVFHGRDRPEGEKNRTRLRAEFHHVAGSVVFLVAASALVLFDRAAVVFLQRKARRDPRLRVPLDVELIQVHRVRRFLNERPIVFELPIALGGEAIDPVGMRIGAGRQINFRA